MEVPAKTYSYCAWALEGAGKACPHSKKLASECESAMHSNFLSVNAYLEESQAEVFAKTWLKVKDATLSLVAKKLEKNVLQLFAGARFEAWLGYHEKAIMAAAKDPELEAMTKAEEHIVKESPNLRFEVPHFVEDRQKGSYCDAGEVQKIKDLVDWLGEMSPLFEAARREWVEAGIPRPKNNPFKIALECYSGGKWSRHQALPSVNGGTMWVVARDTQNDLGFLSANGTAMVSPERARTFESKEAALEWGGKMGATAAMELSWAPVSMVPILNNSNPHLMQLFSQVEAKEIKSSLDKPLGAEKEKPVEPDSGDAVKKRRQSL